MVLDDTQEAKDREIFPAISPCSLAIQVLLAQSQHPRPDLLTSHSFTKSLLSTYCVPSTVLGAETIAVNKAQKSLPLWLTFCWGRQDSR